MTNTPVVVAMTKTIRQEQHALIIVKDGRVTRFMVYYRIIFLV